MNIHIDETPDLPVSHYIYTSKSPLLKSPDFCNFLLVFFRMPEYATRACLMSTEALKSRGMYPEAAVEFIRLTNEVRLEGDLCMIFFICNTDQVFIIQTSIS